MSGSATEEGRAGAVVNLVPSGHAGAMPSHGFELFHDGGARGVPVELRDVLRYHACPAWGTWRFVRHLADLTDREHLYSLRQAAIFDAGSAARRIVDLSARSGYDALAFLSEPARPGSELRWALAVPPASLPSIGKREPRPGRRTLNLVRLPSEIPGLRDATGRMMFSEDCRALVASVNSWLADMDAEPLAPFQKWATPHGVWAFSLPIGGEWCPSKLRAAVGRVEIELPSKLAARLSELIDDQDTHDGRSGRRTLVYEWAPGKTAAGFVKKLRSEMDRAYDMLAANPVGLN
jgi:hypothetical protein